MKKTKKIIDNDQIKVLEDQVTDLDLKWKRALADYQNLEKRTDNERKSFIRFANAALIERILDIIDDLERASKHLKDDGINLIVKQFNDLLKEEQVEEIQALDQIFDPEKMECVEITSGEKDTVTRVTQKGYTMGELILRPAKVEVGSGITKEN
jgi:molecular chaperone GrpE